MIRRIPTILASAFLLLWLPAQTIAAQPEPSSRTVRITAPAGTIAATVSPIPVLITGGNLTSGVVRVDNNSTLIEDIQIRVADYSLDAAGKPVPASPGFEFGSASWYRFQTPDFSLPSGTSRDIPFELVIPTDAAAGDHFAALRVSVTAQPGQATTSAGGASAKTILVFESRLQHRIDGALPQLPTVSLAATNDGSEAHFTARVGNSGNTVIGHQAAPTPTVTLYDLSPWGDASRPAHTLAVGGFYVAPKSERDVIVAWTDLPLIGTYRAVFTLPAADGQPEVTAETTLTVVNGPVIASAAGLALAAILTLVFLVLRRRRPPRAGEDAQPTPEADPFAARRRSLGPT